MNKITPGYDGQCILSYTSSAGDVYVITCTSERIIIQCFVLGVLDCPINPIKIIPFESLFIQSLMNEMTHNIKPDTNMWINGKMAILGKWILGDNCLWIKANVV